MGPTCMPDGSTMPSIGAEQPQIQAITPEVVSPAPKQEIAPKREEVNYEEYIKPSLIRIPHFSYETGSTIHLSKKETIVVGAYLKTNNVHAAVRALNEMYRKHGSHTRFSANAVTAWLKKPHVAQHVARKLQDLGKVNWMDQPKWEAWGVDVMEGRIGPTQVQAVIWREFGKAKGWYKEGASTGFNAQNMQINFVQSDGKA